MSWSLSRFPVDPRAGDALATVGRALHIASRFEQKCKALLRLLGLASAVSDDPAANLANLIANPLEHNVLNRTLRHLQELEPTLSAEHSKLDAARDARNFIAHEAALFNIHQHPGPTLRQAIAGEWFFDIDHLTGHLSLLREQVHRLADGDNLVSAWCYSIEEPHEPLPTGASANYVETVDRWVFDPVWHLIAHNDDTRR